LSQFNGSRQLQLEITNWNEAIYRRDRRDNTLGKLTFIELVASCNQDARALK